MKTKTIKRNKIKKRIRKVVFGTSEKPRMTVFRSNKAIYAQLINDKDEKTLLSASSFDKDIKLESNNKTLREDSSGKLDHKSEVDEKRKLKKAEEAMHRLLALNEC